MVIFLSDTHLGSPYGDPNHSAERRVVDFLRSLPPDVSDIYLLGDILDYWFEYKTVVPRGFVRFFGELARLAGSGIRITWLTGNHDIWLFDYLSTELGIEVIDSPYIVREIEGSRFLLAHGDRIGHNTAGFRFISRFFRNKLCQRLFAALHPGMTVRLAHAWSSHSRYKGHAPTPDERRRIIADASTVAAENPDVKYIVEGHHHVALEADCLQTRLVVLGDWSASGWYATFDGKELQLHEVK